MVYSARSVIAGSTRAARLVGCHVATMAPAITTTATNAYVNGSVGELQHASVSFIHVAITPGHPRSFFACAHNATNTSAMSSPYTARR